MYLGIFEDLTTAATAHDWACINQGVRFDLASEIPLQCCALNYWGEMTRMDAAQAPASLSGTRWDIRCFVGRVTLHCQQISLMMMAQALH